MNRKTRGPDALRVLSRVVLSLILPLALTAVSRGTRAGERGVRGAVASPGAPAFTDSWAQMVQRSATHTPGRRGHAGRTVQPLAPPHVKHPHGPKAPVRQDPGTFTPPSETPSQPASTYFPAGGLEDEVEQFGIGYIPPDTMGAIGPNHFVQILNGLVAIYDRNGVRLGIAQSDQFFSVQVGGVSYPRGALGISDPKVLFDRHTHRWFACSIEFNDPNFPHDNEVLLAVSRTNDPTGQWDKYVLPAGEPDVPPTEGDNGVVTLTDFPILGVDDNGVYVGTNMFGVDPTNVDGPLVDFFARLTVVAKGPLVSPVPHVGPAFTFDDPNLFSMVGATNFDRIGPSDPSWIVAQDGYATGEFHVRSLTWSGGVPALGDDNVLTTADYDFSPQAPSPDAQQGIETGDGSFTFALIRNGQLWAAHDAGVNASGTVNFDEEGVSDADRSAAEWFQVDLTGATPAIAQTGRVWDPADKSPMFYFYPSIAVNGLGQVVLGFSGSNAGTPIGAYTCSRQAGDAPGTMSAVGLLHPGEAPYDLDFGGGRNRWGDYSATYVDPRDDLSIWTVQEYAHSIPFDTTQSFGLSRWGTWVGQIASPAPTLSTVTANVVPGLRGVTLNLSGTGFYEPGPAFPNHLKVELDGGDVNGISNYAVIYHSPTSVTIRFDVAPKATAGARDIVLVNPDGQAAVAVGAITVADTPSGKLKVQRSLGFGGVRRGRSRTQNLVFHNTGTNTLVVNLDPPTGPFTLTGPVSFAIPAGDSQSVPVTFQPLKIGAAHGKLPVTSSDPGHASLTIELNGVGL